MQPIGYVERTVIGHVRNLFSHLWCARAGGFVEVVARIGAHSSAGLQLKGHGVVEIRCKEVHAAYLPRAAGAYACVEHLSRHLKHYH